MVYPSHVEAGLQQIPVRSLVGRDNGAGGNPLPRELDALSLTKKRPRHRPTTPLAKRDDNTPLPAPIGEEPAIDAIFPQIGGSGMTTKGSAIHFNLTVETNGPGLGHHRFSQLVHEHERRLVLHVQIP